MAGHLTVSPWEILRAFQSNARTAPWLFWPPFLFTLGALLGVAVSGNLFLA